MVKWFWDHNERDWSDDIIGKELPPGVSARGFDVTKGPSIVDFLLWLGYLAGLKVPKIWATRDVITYRALRETRKILDLRGELMKELN